MRHPPRREGGGRVKQVPSRRCRAWAVLPAGNNASGLGTWGTGLGIPGTWEGGGDQKNGSDSCKDMRHATSCHLPPTPKSKRPVELSLEPRVVAGLGHECWEGPQDRVCGPESPCFQSVGRTALGGLHPSQVLAASLPWLVRTWS